MTLQYEQRGLTWLARDDSPAWPFVLAASHTYYGKDRLPLNITLTKETARGGMTVILTSHLDLLIASQRRTFCKEAAGRLKTIAEGSLTDLETVVMSMLDGMLQQLLSTRDEITSVSVAEVVVPTDLTPKYALWPIVPEARPGMLVAPSMMGKSTSALMMSVSVVTGHVFVPRLEPRNTGPVLYIGQEETVEQFTIRVAMLCRGHKLEIPKHLYCVRLKGGSLIDSIEPLAKKAADLNAKMVVIDSAQATWGAGGDNVREYASRWFNALEQLAIPTLVIEHPNLEGTKRPTGDLLAAGTSVKRDRVGHAWQLKSVSIAPAPDQPWRYHVTLTDTKRNYVPKQDDINYETLVKGFESIVFREAEALTPETIVDSPSRTDLAVANVMRQEDPLHDEGWTVKDIVAAMGAKDDRRIRQSLNADYWRNADWAPQTRYRFSQIEGTGTSHIFNPAKFAIDVDKKAVEISEVPGGEGDRPS